MPNFSMYVGQFVVVPTKKSSFSYVVPSITAAGMEFPQIRRQLIPGKGTGAVANVRLVKHTCISFLGIELFAHWPSL